MLHEKGGMETSKVAQHHIKTNFDSSGLRHNLAKSMPTPEVPEVYVTSLDSLQGCTTLYVVQIQIQMIQHNNHYLVPTNCMASH